uniref:Uncharacterized protein n=1 Tax=Clytia hemisphaerica TaxID=252671 RepID=A0A7M5WRR0_9CNID
MNGDKKKFLPSEFTGKELEMSIAEDFDPYDLKGKIIPGFDASGQYFLVFRHSTGKDDEIYVLSFNKNKSELEKKILRIKLPDLDDHTDIIYSKFYPETGTAVYVSESRRVLEFYLVDVIAAFNTKYKVTEMTVKIGKADFSINYDIELSNMLLDVNFKIQQNNTRKLTVKTFFGNKVSQFDDCVSTCYIDFICKDQDVFIHSNRVVIDLKSRLTEYCQLHLMKDKMYLHDEIPINEVYHLVIHEYNYNGEFVCSCSIPAPDDCNFLFAGELLLSNYADYDLKVNIIRLYKLQNGEIAKVSEMKVKDDLVQDQNVYSVRPIKRCGRDLLSVRICYESFEPLTLTSRLFILNSNGQKSSEVVMEQVSSARFSINWNMTEVGAVFRDLDMDLKDVLFFKISRTMNEENISLKHQSRMTVLHSEMNLKNQNLPKSLFDYLGV